MRHLALLLLISTVAYAQQTSPPKAARSSPWFHTDSLDFASLIPGPPTPGSVQEQDDMRAVLQAQRTRTAAEVRQAQADDREEDIFIFASVLGPRFSAAELPLTSAFSQHLRDSSAVINPALKLRFARPRPFLASAEVHPVCEQQKTNSFPSGHGMVGTLEALALTQMVPERSSQILVRLNQYMHNRVVCGVHYPSDEAASRLLASSLFGLMAASPAFQQELAAARTEVRIHLNLQTSSAKATAGQNFLAGNTVLIVRHAEKPPESAGQPGLTEAGRHRAEAYVRYFQPFQEDGTSVKITALYAGADSESSIRPRLTLEPLSHATGMTLNAAVGTKDPEGMLTLLRTQPHGNAPLICWRHGQIPTLLKTLGASPETLLPGGKWPDEVYDWVIVLQFDAQGRIQSQERLQESLKLP